MDEGSYRESAYGCHVTINQTVRFVLWTLYALSTLHTVSLFCEFGRRYIESCGNEAWYYARLYSHFFLYPVVFGWSAPIFLYRPLIHIIERVLSLDVRTRTIVIYLSLTLVVAPTVFVSLAQFMAATQPIWSFSTTVTDHSDTLLYLRGELTRRCQGEPVNKERFQSNISLLHQPSTTEYIYRFGLVAMTTLVCVLLTTTILVIALKPGKLEVEKVVTALLFVMFWVIMRVTFNIEKSSIYPEDGLWIALDYILFLLLAALYIQLVVMIGTSSSIAERCLHLMFPFVSVSLTIFSVEKRSEILVYIFGTGATYFTYLGVLMLLMAVYSPIIIRRRIA